MSPSKLFVRGMNTVTVVPLHLHGAICGKIPAVHYIKPLPDIIQSCVLSVFIRCLYFHAVIHIVEQSRENALRKVNEEVIMMYCSKVWDSDSKNYLTFLT